MFRIIRTQPCVVFIMVLIAVAAPALSADAAQADPIVMQLLSAREKQRNGEYSAAQAILVNALSASPDSAALLDALGSVQQDMGGYLDAERTYVHALNASSQARDNRERLNILNNLATLYIDTGQYSSGEKIRAELEKLDPEILQGQSIAFARLLNTMGSLDHERDRDDEAVRYYIRSLQLFHEAQGPVSLDAAAVENNLGYIKFEAGQYDSASDLYRQAVREIESALGSQHPSLVRPLINLAMCLDLSGDPKQAELQARRAVALSVKIFGEEHPVTARAMLEQANALRRLRCKAQARDLEKRAKAVLRSTSAANLTGYTVSLREMRAARR